MERIHVSVRARPLSPDDAESSPWRISGNSICIPNHTSKFEFDRIFGENCKNNEVYSVRVQDIVSAAVHGFNGTVFAYGQTNSGKTHTMRGSRIEPGVICLAVNNIFDVIQQDTTREFLLRMSYMEIYNEEINDLLAPEHRKLQIHESVEKGIFVAGLREEIVVSAEQVIQLLEFGESHRHIGETNMNLYSSRSHSIFRMIIESREKAEGSDSDSSSDAVRVSVLNLVDLAGSERAAKTGAEGARLKEGSHINKSLMTLGTVIKKLSEGVESQGGHVPYRDSKLTRILQPALGGNANTAIICNITLAQIHADETKSSLQFASRALRVTNCAHVNEIMTDAALLKRQKKEIEDLRAKLQGNHSEHLGEEILNLRNTLLKSELERERIALELEEEKKAQAERDRRLQEQAKKIQNLSSMVLCSTRDEQLHHDEQRDLFKKKRRDTWCPGKLATEALGKAAEKASAAKTMTKENGMIPLLPFDDLMDKVTNNEPCEEEKQSRNFRSEDCTLPNPRSLLNVTSRRKGRNRSKSLSKENGDLSEMQAAYEELLLQFESHKTTSENEIDYLKRKLGEAGLSNDSLMEDNNVVTHGNVNKGAWDSEAILVIKQLQEKISMLEMERSSSQQSLECLVEIATKQKITASEKYDELYEELLSAKEDAKFAHDHISEKSPTDENQDFLVKLYADMEEVMLEVENSKILVESLSSVVDELFKCFSDVSDLFVDLGCSISESSSQLKCTTRNFEELQSWLRCEIGEYKNEKLLLLNESLDLRARNEDLNLNLQNSSDELDKISEHHEAERFELHSQIQNLHKEISNLSASSLARERESIRKDFEKTKVKLRETESKLKNIIQEKTKLEGEKAFAERNARLLRDQKAILERDVNKQNYSVGRKHDSSSDRQSSISFDSKGSRAPAAAELAIQAECERLEVLLFEAETTISSLEEDLTVIHHERDEANCRAESLASELDSLSHELNLSNKELETLRDEVSRLKLGLEESKSQHVIVERSVSMLEKDKEELAMQLTDALLAMEEEKAIWSAKEKACVEASEGKINLYTAEILKLNRVILETKEELEISSKKCGALEDKLRILEEKSVSEKEYHTVKALEIETLRNDVAVVRDQNSRFEEDATNYMKERVKLRMRLRGTQMKLNSFRQNFQDKAAELDYAHGEYEKFAVKMKEELTKRGVEILNLRRDLALGGK